MTLLSPDEYMGVLMERRAAWDAEHPPRLGAPSLPEWFIRDGDEDMVDMAAVEAANRAADDQPPRPRRPRTFRPASHWQAELDRIDARLAALDGVTRHPTDDPATHGGIGIRQTPRQRAKYAARLDATSAEYVRLTERRRDINARRLLALNRERKDTP